MNFCKDAVTYDPALPSPKSGSKGKLVSELVKAQEDAAMTMYLYHLSGMGYEPWDYRTPTRSDNDCVRSVWKMVCFTYFPRSNPGCKSGEVSIYSRPCQNSCHNYVAQCGVECCDESVRCSYHHTEKGGNGTELVQSGYVEVDGPAATCTGGARRSVTSPFFLVLAIFGLHWAASASGETEQPARPVKAARCSGFLKRLPVLTLVVGLALCLQSCDSSGIAPKHMTGNWRAKTSYLTDYAFLPNGATVSTQPFLNSCSDKGLPATQQCNGRGYCKAFSPPGLAGGLSGGESGPAFCFCEELWADPECGTERKSQMKAFALSIAFGMFGADYFYLGFPLWGIAKLLTLGGCGLWWLTDIVRITSGNVYAWNYRTANDLNHSWAVLIVVFLFLAIGFLAAIESYMVYRTKRRNDIAFLEQAEESSHWKNTKQHMMQMYGTTPMPKAPAYDSSTFGTQFNGIYTGAEQPTHAGQDEAMQHFAS